MRRPFEIIGNIGRQETIAREIAIRELPRLVKYYGKDDGKSGRVLPI